jgi:hypothetical protein
VGIHHYSQLCGFNKVGFEIGDFAKLSPSLKFNRTRLSLALFTNKTTTQPPTPAKKEKGCIADSKAI